MRDNPRLMAILWRVARLTRATLDGEVTISPVTGEPVDLERELERAMRDLDAVASEWRERNPVYRSSSSKGHRS